MTGSVTMQEQLEAENERLRSELERVNRQELLRESRRKLQRHSGIVDLRTHLMEDCRL